jgi:hypothetical protein
MLAAACDGEDVVSFRVPGTASGPGGKTYKLLVQRDLVELELVDLSRGSAQQRRGCEQGKRLHDGVG